MTGAVATVASVTAPKRRKPEKILLRVVHGALEPFNESQMLRLRARKYAKGDIVAAVITKPRNPGHWALAHKLGTLLVTQCDQFKHMDAHQVLKAVQVASGVACDFVSIGDLVVKIPQSLSFESMDQGEFYIVFRQFCRWISENIWPELSEAQIEKQAELMQEQT